MVTKSTLCVATAGVVALAAAVMADLSASASSESDGLPQQAHHHFVQERQGFLVSTASAIFASVAPSIRNITEAIPHAIESGEAMHFARENWLYLILTVVGGIAAIVFAFRALFVPFVLIRRMEEIGYIQEKRRSNEKLAMDTKLRRKRGNLPPPFPNGWYRLCDSRDLKVKDVKNIDALGQHFVVFRGEDKRVSVLDAYCPHLGANLGIGGKVKGNEIECPFHGWTFNHDGKCTNIPYATKVPEFAKTRKWTSLETNSHVLVWFDAENREPAWFPPSLEEVNSGSWTFRGYTEHNINAHIQEVPENGADIAHLKHVHSPLMASGTDLRATRTEGGPRFQAIGEHVWDASWTPGEGIDKHIGFLELVHQMTIFGIIFSPLNFYVSAQQIGPALVYLKWRSLFGQGVFIQSVTPVAPMEQLVVHTVYAEWKVPTWFAKFVMLSEALQVERDIMIWNNKCFVDKPLLIPEDSLIGKWRRWYSQFYSESSRDVIEPTSLDW
ncbi:Rieske domain-containing protein [Capsaspora owczarzaki ATCC 30864]|uniref:cholesterol 7-desaturase n=1 Tax=Capsaspora owczarzaki (strain ATCC 30864) TaxID=595528 RepID=A0A0D2UG78_CAPO3|nr:Rieske domain-containing protein [Capsaspora owczarzaki ATCC 30864]KJE94081.1 Rieske domain-containing protein [Capsaspora owczarzaki ATCC 30864]|eukprot:XP_004347526.2 Rieske domain-containing protein [Capsaspora owczarzaki ATCC 30864]